MGDEDLKQQVNVASKFILQAIWVSMIILVIFITAWIFNSFFELEIRPVPNPTFEKTILIVKATLVDNEPGAYILEYSNGVTEVLHADGSRELLIFQLEESDDVQPVRSRANADRRQRNNGSPD